MGIRRSLFLSLCHDAYTHTIAHHRLSSLPVSFPSSSTCWCPFLLHYLHFFSGSTLLPCPCRLSRITYKTVVYYESLKRELKTKKKRFLFGYYLWRFFIETLSPFPPPYRFRSFLSSPFLYRLPFSPFLYSLPPYRKLFLYSPLPRTVTRWKKRKAFVWKKSLSPPCLPCSLHFPSMYKLVRGAHTFNTRRELVGSSSIYEQHLVIGRI